MISRVDYFKTHDNLTLRFGMWKAAQRMDHKVRHLIIFLNGRVEFLEKHHETIQELNWKGYDVVSMDWRGQGLSSRMLPEQHKGYVASYTDYLTDLHQFITQIVCPQTQKSVSILAHSMGSHIALRYVHDYPDVVEKLVLLSPMIDIVTSPFPKWLVQSLTRLMIRSGFQYQYAPGESNYLLSKEKFHKNRLTSDPLRFMDEKKAISVNPKLALGGVTYGWLAATFDSINIVTHPGYMRQIRKPVLMIIAGQDRIASVKAPQILCNEMVNGRYTIIPSSRHEILKETDVIRSIFWEIFDQFMKE